MDPNAAWVALCAAVADARWTEAGELADGLLEWLIKGGYPPEITGVLLFDSVVARATCESVASWDLCD